MAAVPSSKGPAKAGGPITATNSRPAPLKPLLKFVGWQKNCQKKCTVQPAQIHLKSVIAIGNMSFAVIDLQQRYRKRYGITSMSDFVDEEHCPLCSHMWRSEREAFRANLDKLPLNEPVCNAC